MAKVRNFTVLPEASTNIRKANMTSVGGGMTVPNPRSIRPSYMEEKYTSLSDVPLTEDVAGVVSASQWQFIMHRCGLHASRSYRYGSYAARSYRYGSYASRSYRCESYTARSSVWIVRSEVLSVWIVRSEVVSVWIVRNEVVSVWILHSEVVSVWIVRKLVQIYSRDQ